MILPAKLHFLTYIILLQCGNSQGISSEAQVLVKRLSSEGQHFCILFEDVYLKRIFGRHLVILKASQVGRFALPIRRGDLGCSYDGYIRRFLDKSFIKEDSEILLDCEPSTKSLLNFHSSAIPKNCESQYNN